MWGSSSTTRIVLVASICPQVSQRNEKRATLGCPLSARSLHRVGRFWPPALESDYLRRFLHTGSGGHRNGGIRRCGIRRARHKDESVWRRGICSYEAEEPTLTGRAIPHDFVRSSTASDGITILVL